MYLGWSASFRIVGVLIRGGIRLLFWVGKALRASPKHIPFSPPPSSTPRNFIALQPRFKFLAMQSVLLRASGAMPKDYQFPHVTRRNNLRSLCNRA